MMRGVIVAAAVTAFAGVALVAIFLAATGASDGTPWVELEVGECFDLGEALADGTDDPLFRVETVPCADPHDAEIVATGELDPDGDREYPADDELFELVDRRCRVEASVDAAVYGILPIAPDERTWRGRSGRYACVAVVAGGGTVSGSALR